MHAGLPLRLGSSSDRRQRNVADFLVEALPASGTPPVLEFQPLRGAVDRRLARIALPADDPAALDGVVLALAGLNRLWKDPDGRRAIEPCSRARFMVLPLSRCPAAAGQYLAIERRADDADVRTAPPFDDPPRRRSPR